MGRSSHIECPRDSRAASLFSDDNTVWQIPARLPGTRYHPVACSSRVSSMPEGVHLCFELSVGPSNHTLPIDAHVAQFQLA